MRYFLIEQTRNDGSYNCDFLYESKKLSEIKNEYAHNHLNTHREPENWKKITTEKIFDRGHLKITEVFLRKNKQKTFENLQNELNEEGHYDEEYFSQFLKKGRSNNYNEVNA